jgi:hypothetical protein
MTVCLALNTDHGAARPINEKTRRGAGLRVKVGLAYGSVFSVAFTGTEKL